MGTRDPSPVPACLPTILVVEDDEATRATLQVLLEAEGFRVLAAATGTEALSLATADPPDLIIQDMILPDIGGMELCSRLRTLPGSPNLPILALTGAGSSREDPVGSLAGFDEVFRKPADPAALLASIRGRLAPPDPEARILTLERELVRLRGQNLDLVRRIGLKDSALVALEALPLLGPQDAGPQAAATALSICLEACGLPSGAIYLAEPSGQLVLAARHGFERAPPPLVEQRFGLDSLWSEVLADGHPRVLGLDHEAAGAQVGASGHAHVVLARLGPEGRCLGGLLLGVDGAVSNELPFLVHSVGLQLGQGLGVLRAYRTLAESEARIAALVENANDGMLVTDLEGRILQANRRAEELFGVARKEIEGTHFIDFVDPSVAARELDRFADLLRTGTLHSRAVPLKPRDDSRRMVDVSVSKVTVDGRTVLFALLRDMTREAELEAELRHSQRLEGIGRLAGGIAHDFNNLMGVVLGFADLALDGLDPDQPRHRELKMIREAGEKAAGLTRQLLAFSRTQILDFRVIDLGSLVGNLQKMLERVLGEDLTYRYVPTTAPLPVRVDAAQVEQVLVNLAINVRDAMPKGGVMTVSTGRVAADPRPESEDPVPTPYAWVEVRDTGTGIDETVRHRLFEPFFTTKPQGKGTGLGLSTSYGIVSQLRGFFQVESSPGTGTAFRFYIPVQLEASAPLPPVPHAGDGRGTETILVVEDDPMLRPLVVRSLQRFGYTAVAAEGPQKAMELFLASPDGFGLVLTDVIMPSMSGPVLVRRIRETRPDQAVLYMSGFLDHQSLEEGGPELHSAMIAKPFLSRDLARKVREILDRPGIPKPA